MIAPQVLLLDTCVILFLSMATRLKQDTVDLLDKAAAGGDLMVSPVSALEIGLAAARGRLALTDDPLTYFNLFIERSGAVLCEMNPDVLVASSFLPGQLHKDPMDRILISTARRNDFTLVTSDRGILAYGEAGFVKTLAC